MSNEDTGNANLGLSLISIGCGVGALLSNESDTKCALATCSGLFWSCQLIESFTCPTWSYLNNIMTAD